MDVDIPSVSGDSLTYFTDGEGGGGVRENFLGLKFWPKGIFFESVKDAGIFCGSQKKNQEFFWGIALFISSN